MHGVYGRATESTLMLVTSVSTIARYLVDSRQNKKKMHVCTSHSQLSSPLAMTSIYYFYMRNVLVKVTPDLNVALFTKLSS